MFWSIHNKELYLIISSQNHKGSLFSFAGMWESKFKLLQEHVLYILKGLNVENSQILFIHLLPCFDFIEKNGFTVSFHNSQASKFYFIFFLINRCLHRATNKTGFLGWNYLQCNKTFQVDGFPRTGIFNIWVAQREYWHKFCMLHYSMDRNVHFGEMRRWPLFVRWISITGKGRLFFWRELQQEQHNRISQCPEDYRQKGTKVICLYRLMLQRLLHADSILRMQCDFPYASHKVLIWGGKALLHAETPFQIWKISGALP